MKKVCMFVWNSLVNDARVKREAFALAEVGYNVKIICLRDHDLNIEECINKVRIKRIMNLNFINKFNKLKSLNYLISILNVLIIVLGMIVEGLKEDFDIYHCNDLKTLTQGYICSKIMRRRKLIYDAHEVETSRTGNKGKVKYRLEKYLVKKIDKMIMTTDTRADYTAKLYNIEKPKVIHNYPIKRNRDTSKFNLYQLLDISTEEPIFLYQGGFQPGRGIECILEAIPKFKSGVTVFIGDGILKNKMIKMIENLGIKHKVRLISTVPENDLLYYTQHAFLGFQVLQNTCFNHYSALSNKLLEYIMMEVPVIATDFPEIKKVVEDKGVGICINPHSSNNIAKAVNYFIENKTQYINCKENCKIAREILNWENEKQKLYKVYSLL